VRGKFFELLTMFVRLLAEAVARSGVGVEQLMRGAGLHPAPILGNCQNA